MLASKKMDAINGGAGTGGRQESAKPLKCRLRGFHDVASVRFKSMAGVCSKVDVGRNKHVQSSYQTERAVF